MEATPGQTNVHPTVPSDRGIAVPIVPWHPEVVQSFHEFPAILHRFHEDGGICSIYCIPFLWPIDYGIRCGCFASLVVSLAQTLLLAVSSVNAKGY